MTEKTIIITGASRGLGAAAARIAAEMGANVVLNARTEGALDAVVTSIRAEGGAALAIPGDVSTPEDCRALLAAAVERFGGLDALVNNAGIIEPIAPIAEGRLEAWTQNLAVNVLGPVMLTQAALPYLRKRAGRVINVSSGAAVKVVPGWGAYSAAKAAINSFTNILAAEEPEITAIAFRPGAVDTAMQDVIRRDGATGMPDEFHKKFVNLFAGGALLPPELPGKALALLALDAPHEWSGEFIPWDDARIQKLAG